MNKYLMVLTLLLYCFVRTNNAQAQNIVYVDIDASGLLNGTSWTDAYDDLSDALTFSSNGDTIWVADGTYYGGFAVPNGKDLVIMGGFNGTETASSQRDWETNLTILDGNSTSRVITMANLTTASEMSGFIVQNGSNTYGGGINTTGSGTKFYDMLIKDNVSGGSNGSGGGVHAVQAKGLRFENVEFSGNSARFGAAINGLSTVDSISIVNCVFDQNIISSAIGGGGVLHLSTGSYSVIDNCTFTNNYGYDGTVKFNDIDGSVRNSIFENNSAAYGGALYSAGSVTVENCVFANNTATELGGVVYKDGLTEINNCTFYGNDAPYGGAVYSFYDFNGASEITNSIFFNNTSSLGAADIDFDSYYQNSGSENLTISNCAIENDPGTYTGVTYTNNLPFGTDPNFTDVSDLDGADDIWMTSDDGLVVASNSPVLGAGIYIAGIPLDIAGATRPNPPAIGAYESECDHVESNAPTAICQDLTIYLDATGNASITANDVDNGSTDNCGISTMSIDNNAFTCAESGTNTITLTVTDFNSNSSTCTSTVTVLDTITPVVLCQDITVYLDATGNVSITANDIDNGSTDNCTGSLTVDNASFTCSEMGANNVTLTMTDGSGNFSACTSTVTVLDTISPTAVLQNAAIYLDASGMAILEVQNVDNGSYDNCSIASMTLSESVFNCNDLGAQTVYVTMIDGSGNSTLDSAIVTVIDNIVPTISCQNITVSLSNSGAASITSNDISPNVWDNCSTNLSLSNSDFTCNEIGSNTVTLTAIDPSGNTNTCSSVVTVIDDLSPEPILTVLQDIESTCKLTQLDDPAVTDNCSGVTISNDASLPITSSTTVVWTYTDASGNVSYQTQEVVISGVNTSVIQTSEITLEAENTTADNYQWVDCNNNFAPTAGEILYFFEPQANGSYAVIVTEGTCSDTSSCYQINTVGVEELTSQNLILAPNPANGQIVKVLFDGQIVQLTMYSLDGQQVVVPVYDENHTLDISSLRPGLYMVKIVGENREFIERLVLTK